MTDLEKARLELKQAKKKKLETEHQLIRSQNRLKNALKKQDKERTHRLIQEGAELEYVFDGIENLPISTFWEFMRKLSDNSEIRELYEACRAKQSTVGIEKLEVNSAKEGGES